MMSMVRLRRGIDIDHPADRFASLLWNTSRIFNSKITFLGKELPPYLLKWPSKELVWIMLPHSLKHFPNTRVIIDFTELFIQRPSMPPSQRKIWSSYNHLNTFKALLGCTPQDTFPFYQISRQDICQTERLQ
ncbi:hypothetical protein LSH36_1018g00000 [Paralvinella palmiformis]|uniref:DDE Tnp4 domain-containing protein n=1 Tax=Paralvinella palmiformis TaxID=53620 RepID=A0AAD9IVU2_9ANNE|nr:hypothetical protein LSH36_1018g00000 [Paralvinella palmiformis]